MSIMERDRVEVNGVHPAAVQRPAAPAKLRILETAYRLFYAEGIRTVGIDKLISESTVTKATFYKHYGSKDRLILEYISRRHTNAVNAFDSLVQRESDPQRVLGEIIEIIAAEVLSPNFRGCAFINAAIEFPDPSHPVRLIVSEHREWYVLRISSLLAELGHPLPGEGADEFILAREGAMTGGYASDPVAASTAFVRITARLLARLRN